MKRVDLAKRGATVAAEPAVDDIWVMWLRPGHREYAVGQIFQMSPEVVADLNVNDVRRATAEEVAAYQAAGN